MYVDGYFSKEELTYKKSTNSKDYIILYPYWPWGVYPNNIEIVSYIWNNIQFERILSAIVSVIY